MSLSVTYRFEEGLFNLGRADDQNIGSGFDAFGFFTNVIDI